MSFCDESGWYLSISYDLGTNAIFAMLYKIDYKVRGTNDENATAHSLKWHSDMKFWSAEICISIISHRIL